MLDDVSHVADIEGLVVERQSPPIALDAPVNRRVLGHRVRGVASDEEYMSRCEAGPDAAPSGADIQHTPDELPGRLGEQHVERVRPERRGIKTVADSRKEAGLLPPTPDHAPPWFERSQLSHAALGDGTRPQRPPPSVGYAPVEPGAVIGEDAPVGGRQHDCVSSTPVYDGAGSRRG